MASASVILVQGLEPEAARSAAWAVIALGVALGAGVVAIPLFLMFLFRRARLREQIRERRNSQPQIDPWEEAGRRMSERVDPLEDQADDGEDEH